MACGHEIWEQDTAAHFDGHCPLCLLADRAWLLSSVISLEILIKAGKPHDQLLEVCQHTLKKVNG